METIVAVIWLLIFIWMVTASGSRRTPPPQVVIMTGGAEREQSIAGELFILVVLLALYLLGTATA
jgi:hypothetical protein